MRHRHRNPPDDFTKPILPITAFLDFSFQLLAFFIITFKPPSMEGQLALQLPKAGDTDKLSPPDNSRLADDPEELFVVRVQSDKSGNIADLELVVPKVADPIKFKNDTGELLKELKKRVEEKKATKEPLPKLEYQFAENLNYQYVIKLLDDGKSKDKGGFEKVSPTLLLPDKPKADGK